jgi:hypothetical protein
MSNSLISTSNMWTLTSGIERDLGDLNVIVNLRVRSWLPSIASGIRNEVRRKVETVARNLGHERSVCGTPSAMK